MALPRAHLLRSYQSTERLVKARNGNALWVKFRFGPVERLLVDATHPSDLGEGERFSVAVHDVPLTQWRRRIGSLAVIAPDFYPADGHSETLTYTSNEPVIGVHTLASGQGPWRFRTDLAGAASYINGLPPQAKPEHIVNFTYPEMANLKVRLGFESTQDVRNMDPGFRADLAAQHAVFCALNGLEKNPSHPFVPTMVHMPTEVFIERFGQE